MTHFSKRKQDVLSTIPVKFWEAFKAYIEELRQEGWLSGEFGGYLGLIGNYPQWYVEKEKLNLKMTQEIGSPLFPLNELEQMPDSETLFKLIEFFFKYVSKPVKIGTSYSYDSQQGRYEYTIRINQLFDNFHLPFRLEKGKVKYLHSPVFDKYISEIDFNIPDEETQNLILLALEKFYSRKFEDQKIGLEKLVDALQRITSWENRNKRKSIDTILEKISIDENIKEFLDKELKKLKEVANDRFMIRHTEKGKIPIKDKDLLEYLFYSYFNIIRFILRKYGYIEEKAAQIGDD